MAMPAWSDNHLNLPSYYIAQVFSIASNPNKKCTANVSQQTGFNTPGPQDSGQARKLIWLSGEYRAICDQLLTILTTQQISLDHSKASSGVDLPQSEPLLWIGSEPSSEYRLALGKRFGPDFDVSDEDLVVAEQSAVVQHLGTEHQLIIFDATRHFDANAFAAICGTLIHNGRLYLLTPPADQWALHGRQRANGSFPATSATETATTTARFAVGEPAQDLNLSAENHSQQDHFLKRFIRLLCDGTHVISDLTKQDTVLHRELVIAPAGESHSQPAALTDNNELTKADSKPESTAEPSLESAGKIKFPLTVDQQYLMDKLLLETETLNKQIWLITADRGRGKSALLGMLLAELHNKSKESDKGAESEFQKNQEFLISGPSKRATQVMHRHFRDSCASTRHHTSLNPPLALTFCPPDELLNSRVRTSLLIVDEAAAIPLPMLKKLLNKFPKVIMATTVHGYEGAGRGFEIRLRQWLRHQNLDSQWLRLSQPVRWLPGDRLEHFCNKAFLLNANIPELSTSQGSEPYLVRELSSAELIENELLLNSVFALLVQAHYQTKPMDLQHLLDGANLRIFVLESRQQVIGVAWLAAEGPFSDNTLKMAIVRNQRRPYGHLLPQVLSQWTGQQQALDYRLSRVVRLAIHPKLQRRGIGSLFVRQLIEVLDKENLQTPFAGIGALFAAEPGIVNFWKKNGFQPFHLGARENKRSGLRSIAMLRSMGATNFSNLLDDAINLYRINYRQDFDQVPEYRPDVTTTKDRPPDPSSGIESNNLVQDYISGYRSFENSREFIRLQIIDNRGSEKIENLDPIERSLPKSSLKDKFSFVRYARDNQYQGKKQAETHYRNILKKVLSDA